MLDGIIIGLTIQIISVRVGLTNSYVAGMEKMQKYLLVALIILGCMACSSVWKMQSLELADESLWVTERGIMGNSITHFYQKGFFLNADSATISIYPSLLPDRLLSIGPPFLPVIPHPGALFSLGDSLSFEITVVFRAKGVKWTIKPDDVQFYSTNNVPVHPMSSIIGTKDTSRVSLLFTGPHAHIASNQDSVIVYNESVAVRFFFCVPEDSLAFFNVIDVGVYENGEVIRFPELRLKRENEIVISWMTL